MRYIKHKAFTLAEVMILLLTLSVLMAAFAPIMTKREHNMSFDDVWSYVQSDDFNDAYFDVANKSYTAQAFIGVPAKKALDVATSSSDGNNNILYSKLVIRSSHKLKSNVAQGQMQFRAGNTDKGTLLGALFAGRGNMLLGGKYFNIRTDESEAGSSNARWNTAFGKGALTDLTTGQANTAVGNSALGKLTTSEANTAVGYYSGYKLSSATGNTFVGPNSGATVTSGSYNTLLGYSIYDKDKSFTGSNNTLMGGLPLSATNATGNTSVGYDSLKSLITGNYNTAIGGSSFQNLTTGKYNTAVGYSAGDFMSTGSHKTFVGAFSGSKGPKSASYYPVSSLYEGDTERVFIGSLPKDTVVPSSSMPITGSGPGAVLEVHNVTGRDSNNRVLPISGLGHESVVVNGNLVVRGQSYWETPLWRQSSYANETNQANPRRIPKGLVAYRILKLDKVYAMVAYDGARRDRTSHQGCRGCRRHAYNDMRVNCICTSGDSSTKSYNTDFATWVNSTARGGSVSYDWLTPSSGNIEGGCDANFHPMGKSYIDGATGGTITIERNANGEGGRYGSYKSDDWRARGTDYPLAHLRGSDKKSDGQYDGGIIYSSCCPNLTITAGSESVCTKYNDNGTCETSVKTSDARLKNIGTKFTAGLAELKRLDIYNFTFKNDVNNIPHVGVMAQDLKLVFPNAVTKDENGYYKIRWDEMLYAVVNSVKDLNARIEKIASKIANDKSRIAALKKDNQELNAKLDKLEAELTVLESKK